MTLWQWILVAVVIAVLVAAAGVLITRRGGGHRHRTERLQEHFGPEYERLVSGHGDQRSAEEELLTRAHQRDKLDIVALTPRAREYFVETWRQVQAAFIDDPATAVGSADTLVTDVMRQRGYPVDDFDRRADDISVDHPHIVENYRAAHDIHLSARDGMVSTEDQRRAFVHYRALFTRLLDTTDNNHTSEERT